jgi:hypothetical protein
MSMSMSMGMSMSMSMGMVMCTGTVLSMFTMTRMSRGPTMAITRLMVMTTQITGTAMSMGTTTGTMATRMR